MYQPMPNDNETPTSPPAPETSTSNAAVETATPQPSGKADKLTDPRDKIIAKMQAELVSKNAELQHVRDTHDFQQKRADVAEAEAQGATKSIEALQNQLAAASTSDDPKTGDTATIDGVSYSVLGTYRADNTFLPVKQRYLEENTLLVAVDRKF